MDNIRKSMANISASTTGKKLRELRSAFGLSQNEFGKRIGVARGAIAQYEQGNNRIPSLVMEKIIKSTGIGLEYFTTSMGIDEAIEKYRSNEQSERPKMDFVHYATCGIFLGLQNYADDIMAGKDLYFDSFAMLTIFRADIKGNGSFVRLLGAEGAPIADDGDIIVVGKIKPKESDFVVVRNGEGIPLIARYCLSEDKIMLRTLNDFLITFKEDEMEILGVIKSILSVQAI